MNHRQHQKKKQGGLSDEQKRAWDKIIENLANYFATEEGAEFYVRFLEVFQRKTELPLVVLTPNENRALHYIRSMQRRGDFPSVREVARELGFRSSRSGFKVMRLLRDKGLV